MAGVWQPSASPVWRMRKQQWRTTKAVGRAGGVGTRSPGAITRYTIVLCLISGTYDGHAEDGQPKPTFPP